MSWHCLFCGSTQPTEMVRVYVCEAFDKENDTERHGKTKTHFVCHLSCLKERIGELVLSE